MGSLDIVAAMVHPHVSLFAVAPTSDAHRRTGWAWLKTALHRQWFDVLEGDTTGTPLIALDDSQSVDLVVHGSIGIRLLSHRTLLDGG